MIFGRGVQNGVMRGGGGPLVYFDNTYWTGISNISWDGDSWLETGFDAFIMYPAGSWKIGFRPSTMRISYDVIAVDTYGPGFALRDANNQIIGDTGIIAANHALGSYVTDMALSFVSGSPGGDIDIFRDTQDAGPHYYDKVDITNIEFIP